MKNKFILFVICLLLTKLNAQTIDASLIELNFSGDGNPKNITVGLNKIFFSADDGVHGRELWLHNSITNTTTLVKDIYLGSQYGVDDSKFIIINDILYFIGSDLLTGDELWRSDGTETGTYLIKDINNSGDSYISNLISYNGSLIFTANDNINGSELWISDGTASGTTILKDIYAGSNGSYPSDTFIFNNKLFFVANDGVKGNEIWISDGTSSGTLLLKDINPNSNFGGVQYGNKFIFLGGNFYFFCE